MINDKDGRPAFPVDEYSNDLRVYLRQGGMTLRDYFAAKALQGLLADPTVFGYKGEGVQLAYARAAYLYADAMLEVREDYS